MRKSSEIADVQVGHNVACCVSMLVDWLEWFGVDSEAKKYGALSGETGQLSIQVAKDLRSLVVWTANLP